MSEVDDSTGDDTGQDSGGAEAGSFFASCDAGSHPAFIGPTRSTRKAAQDDADQHNLTCDVAGVVVVSLG
jgi:hypothetical protein